jgi:magnesium-transporting ATPase (P-type)
VAEIAAAGRRVLLVAEAEGALADAETLPDGLRPVGYVVLAEELRTDAAEIMAYFARQHVDVKIISGDNSETVSAVGQRLGVAGAEHHVDLRTSGSAVGDTAVVEATTVFGRVSPEQKRDLIDTLQAAGHTVAMTGDGVNDIPSLKRADIGIAMDTATPATKSVAQVVLLDGRFDRLPDVVAEGRRVIANMERVSALFITKTVYSVLLILAIGVSGSVFPFLPRHMSLVSELTIGVPAFLLSFRAADRPSRPGYLRRVMRFALPAGMLAATVTLTTYWVAKSPWVDASLNEARSVATMALSVTALWILLRLMQPLDRLDLVLMGALLVALVIVAATDPTQRFYALEWPALDGAAVIAVMGLLGIVAFEVARTRLHPLRWRWLIWLLDQLGAAELAKVTFGPD